MISWAKFFIVPFMAKNESTRDKFLADVDAFTDKHGLSVNKLSELVVGDEGYLRRVIRGQKLDTDSYDKIVAFMKSYRPPKKKTNDRREMAGAAA